MVLASAVNLSLAVAARAQQENLVNKGSEASPAAVAGAVPRLVRFSGVVTGQRGASVSGIFRLTFSIFEEQSGGAALWSEVQDVRLDAQARYSVLLGAASSDGLPAELFSTAGARWLGVQVDGRQEDSRVLLVAVPYALKAADADTLGGKPATAFVASDQLKDQVRDEVKTQVIQSGDATRTLIGAAPAPQAIGEGKSSFVCNVTTDCVTVTQSGAGVGLHATTPTGTSVLGELSGPTGAAVYGRATAGSGAASAVQGDAAAPNAVGVLGRAFGTTGTSKGVFGRTFSTSGTGVHGDATTATGATRGVWGTTVSTGGVGVYGQSAAATGFTTGVSGTVASTSGVAVYGLAGATSGATIGVQAKVSSPAGTAIVADNTAGGKIFSGRVNFPGVEKFSVDGSGNVSATGTLTGSRSISTVTTGTAPLGVSSTTLVSNLNADFLDGLHAASFALLGANAFLGNQVVTGNVSASGTGSFTGGLGVGTGFLVNAAGQITTPSVGTDALADGAVTAAKLASDRLQIAAMAFNFPQGSGSAFVFSQGNYSTSGGSSANCGGFSGNSCEKGAANVSLPQGTVVTGFQVCGQDNDTGHELAGYLYAKPQNDTFGAPTLMASVHSGIAAATSSTQCLLTTTITDAVINNTANAYYVELDVGDLTSAIGVQIIH